MIESIEGKRGLPRHKPPYPSQVGLFGRPTLVHNVETLYWVRDILERGPEWFAGEGRNGRKGRRSYSVSGRVREPGVKFAPAGITGSLTTNFRRSANDCSNPQGPTTFGPRRSMTAAQILRSA